MATSKINELSLDTYATAMDRTERYPWADMLAGDNKDAKARAGKQANVNGLARQQFEKQWRQNFVGQKINFVGKKTGNNYSFPVYGLKFNANYTNFDILLQAEQNSLIWIKNPLYIDKHDLTKIAPEPVSLDPNSRKLLDTMFGFGLSKQHAGQNHIGESFVNKIIREATEFNISDLAEKFIGSLKQPGEGSAYEMAEFWNIDHKVDPTILLDIAAELKQRNYHRESEGIISFLRKNALI